MCLVFRRCCALDYVGGCAQAQSQRRDSLRVDDSLRRKGMLPQPRGPRRIAQVRGGPAQRLPLVSHPRKPRDTQQDQVDLSAGPGRVWPSRTARRAATQRMPHCRAPTVLHSAPPRSAGAVSSTYEP